MKTTNYDLRQVLSKVDTIFEAGVKKHAQDARIEPFRKGFYTGIIYVLIDGKKNDMVVKNPFHESKNQSSQFNAGLICGENHAREYMRTYRMLKNREKASE